MTGSARLGTLAWRAAIAGVILSMALATIPDPAGTFAIKAYLVPVTLCAALLVATLPRIPRRQRPHWRWLVVGTLLFVVADFWSTRDALIGAEGWPTPADAFYFGAQLLIGAGILRMNGGRVGVTYRGDVLDSAIVTTSAGVLSVVFFVLPVASDSSLSMLGKLVSSAYPIIDVLLIYLLARMMTTRTGRTSSHWLLVAAQGSTLVADLGWNLTQLVTGGQDSYPRWMNFLWLSWYLLLVLAARHASTRDEPREEPDAVGSLTALRLVALTVASLMPVGILLTLNALNKANHVGWLGAGGLLLGLLVTVRMWDLLQQLRAQTARVAELARLDSLTGLPNRRTWDDELARACRPRADDTRLRMVALLDFDHFKAYNDASGHEAGDDLLRAAATAWTDVLDGDGFIARWGGEEFAVLLVSRDEQQALAVLANLRAAVPYGQTCSVGAAIWDGAQDPATVFRRADRALYAAKDSGRNRVVMAPTEAPPVLPTPRVASDGVDARHARTS